MRGLRLPLPRRPDPVLTEEELEFLDVLLDQHIAWSRRERARGLVSESVIRHQMTAEAARAKIAQVIPRDRP